VLRSVPVPTCRRHYPGGPAVAIARPPSSSGLPPNSAGSASASPFSRPA